MNYRKSFPLAPSNNCLEILRQTVKDASAVITNDVERCNLLTPCLGPSPYGSIELLNPRKIDRYFDEGNLKKMTDVVTHAAYVLCEFSNDIGKETAQNPSVIRQKAMDILDLAIQSNAFTGRRHHLRFYKDETNLDRIVGTKNYILNIERRILEKEEAKTRFSNNP